MYIIRKEINNAKTTNKNKDCTWEAWVHMQNLSHDGPMAGIQQSSTNSDLWRQRHAEIRNEHMKQYFSKCNRGFNEIIYNCAQPTDTWQDQFLCDKCKSISLHVSCI